MVELPDGGIPEGDPSSMETVLVGLCGLSPAVITETVWALTKADPPIIPDRVVILTTGEGRKCLRDDLFGNGIWRSLLDELGVSENRIVFGDTGDSIRVFPRSDQGDELSDIVSSGESAAVADYMLETVRQFTENPDTRILFSVAGGRKTMTALAALCMSLLGRTHDRLCHVLVNPPFDRTDLSPRFFFPRKPPIFHSLPDGTEYCSDDANISLCEIPFVRTRYLFEDRYLRLPGAFSRTVEMANLQIRTEYLPHLKIDPAEMVATLDQTVISLSAAEFVLYWMLAQQCLDGPGPIVGTPDLCSEFGRFADSISPDRMPEIINHSSGGIRFRSWRDLPKQTRKLPSKLKGKIIKAVGESPKFKPCLPTRKRGHYGLDLIPEKITICGCDVT